MDTTNSTFRIKDKIASKLERIKKTLAEKKILGLLSLILLAISIIGGVILTQKETKTGKVGAQSSSGSPPVQISQGQSLSYQARSLIPGKTTTFNIWRLNTNPPSNTKIGLSGVFLAGENLPEILSAYNKSYGDKLVGTADDTNGPDQMRKHLYMLMAAGVKTIGLGLEWKRAEPTNTNPSTFDWSLYDLVFDTIKTFSDTYNYTFEPVVFVDTPPRWMSSAKPQSTPYLSSFGKFPPKDLWTVPIWESSTDPTPQDPNTNLNPNGSARYNRLLRAAVERYRPGGTKAPTSNFGIRNWVVWNEANWEFFRDPSDPNGQRYMPSMKPYVYLLKSAGDTIHSVDPSLKVLTSGFADGDYSWAEPLSDGSRRSIQNTVRKLYQETELAFGPTGKNSFDVLNVHTYLPSSTTQSKFNELISIKSQNGDSAKKIWVTEWGCDASECLTSNLNQLLTKWQTVKQIFNGISDIEKHTLWDSRGYFIDIASVDDSQDVIPDAKAAIDLISDPARVSQQWGIFAGALYTSFKIKPIFRQLAQDTGALISETIQTATADTSGTASITIPGNVFANPGKYLIFHSQDNRINTELPGEVIVTAGNQTPTPTVSPTTPTPTNSTPGGTYTIKVRAKGYAKDTNEWPKLRLYFNHAVGTNVPIEPHLTEWTTTGSYQDFTYSFNTQPNQLDLVFPNRNYNSVTGVSTAIYIDSVSINNSPLFPSNISCFFDSGSGNRAFDGQSTSPTCLKGQAVWANGSFRFKITPGLNIQPTPTPRPTSTPPSSLEHTITVKARGFVKNTTQWPKLRLYLNHPLGANVPLGSHLTEWTTSGVYQNYTYSFTTSPTQIDLVFPNRAFDSVTGSTSALFLDSVSLDGKPVFPTSASCFFDSGTDIRAFDGTTTNPTCIQGKEVWSNGSFRFTNLP